MKTILNFTTRFSRFEEPLYFLPGEPGGENDCILRDLVGTPYLKHIKQLAALESLGFDIQLDGKKLPSRQRAA